MASLECLYIHAKMHIQIKITSGFAPSPKLGVFWISRKTGSQIQNFLGFKPPCDQDGAKKKV